ncbi:MULTISPECIES: hypothetical protein [unclassified Microbacterium]|nr:MULTISPECIES: hypothetical protein [unclassified Microbacterium]
MRRRSRPARRAFSARHPESGYSGRFHDEVLMGVLAEEFAANR